MGIVDNLVGSIRTEWAAQGFRATAFPDIAARALAEANLTGDTARGQLFDRLMDSECPVTGHPASNVVTLYHGSRFSVHLHLWQDGEGQLHHHAWCGAYQTLAGSSIDATYSFRPVEVLRRGLIVGDFAQRDIRHMRPGDLRMIEPGSSFIHGFSYLSKTALTISVRTRELYDSATMEYLRPAVGVQLQDAHSAPEYITERARVLSFLHEADPQQHRERLIRMAGHGDPLVSFAALRHAQTTQVRDEDLAAMRDTGVRTHGPVFDILFDSSRDLKSLHYLHEQRLREPDDQTALRTLLSLLHVCLDRDALLVATSEIVGVNDPVQWITANAVRLLERASEPAPADWLEGVGEILRHLVAGVGAGRLAEVISNDYELDSDELQSVPEIALELLSNPAFRVLRTESGASLTREERAR